MHTEFCSEKNTEENKYEHLKHLHIQNCPEKWRC